MSSTSSSDSVLMSSVLKVQRGNTSAHKQYCYCFLEQLKSGQTILHVYKAKKPLSHKQRLKAKAWFTVVISAAVRITRQNSVSKYIFHVEEGGCSSSFSSKCPYNRDSWVETLRSCNHTATDDAHLSTPANPYGKDMYDHTGSSPFSSRKSLVSSDSSSARRSSQSLSNSISLLDDWRAELPDDVQLLTSDASSRGPGESHMTTNQKHRRSSRQKFLMKMMSEKETAAAASMSECDQTLVHADDDDEDSNPRAPSTVSGKGKQVGVAQPEPASSSSFHQTTPAKSNVRSSNRQQFLNSIMVEKEKECQMSKSTSILDEDDKNNGNDDEFDFVPKSSVKANRVHHPLRVHPVQLTSDVPSNSPERPQLIHSSTIIDTSSIVPSSPNSRANHPIVVGMQTPTRKSKFLPAYLNFSSQSTRSGKSNDASKFCDLQIHKIVEYDLLFCLT